MAIQSARAFCRELGKDHVEAVDFLGLRAPGGLGDVAAELDGEAFARSLSELIADDMTESPPRQTELSTRVYFERQSPADGRYLLVIDARDSDRLLHAVSSALHGKAMRVMACEIKVKIFVSRQRSTQ